MEIKVSRGIANLFGSFLRICLLPPFANDFVLLFFFTRIAGICPACPSVPTQFPASFGVCCGWMDDKNEKKSKSAELTLPPHSSPS